MANPLKMIKGVVFASMLLSFMFPGTVEAQTTNWIQMNTIKDLTGNVVLREGEHFIAGHAYNCTFTVTVPYSQEISQFEVTLSSDFTEQGPQYWYLLTPSYKGYDPSSWTPGSKAISFGQEEGKLIISAFFKIPLTLTVKQVENINYRLLKSNFMAISINVTGGSQVGSFKMTVSDAAIENYLTTSAKKSTLVTSGELDKAYEPFLQSIMSQAASLYNLGLVEKATEVLNIVNPTIFPVPPSNTMNTLLIAGLGVVALVAIASILLLMRARGKLTLTQSQIEDTKRELAGFEVSVARLDERLANQVKSIRMKLEEEG